MEQLELFWGTQAQLEYVCSSYDNDAREQDCLTIQPYLYSVLMFNARLLF